MGQLDLDQAIVELVSREAVKVPPYPAVAMKVEQVLRRQDYGLDELARLVAADQVLAADTLRCANSAFYARGAPATTIGQAVSRIGAKELARLAVASGLGVHARAPGPLAPLKRGVWLEALASAAIAQELAGPRKLSADEAFVCGLLHDFGKVIAITCIEEVLARHPGEGARPAEAWWAVVDRFHVELGLVLAAKWSLPQLVSDVISLHHAEDLAGAGEPRLVELIATTDRLVELLRARSGLGREDLAAVGSLAPEECDLVGRVLDRLPGFVASFEGSQPAPAPSATLLEGQAHDHYLTGPTPVDFAVTATVGRDKRAYRAMAIATSNIMMKGPTPIAENVLIQLELATTPPLSCWATSKLSWPEGDGHVVLLQPFALNGPALKSWQELVKQTTE
jgi:putative nucleotidyltransferase with HDIG domain